MAQNKEIFDDEYEKRKRKREEEIDKINKRQEEYDIIYKKEKQKSDFKTLLSNLKFETYTKRLVGLIIFVGLVDLQLSYVLAFMDKIQIAETLSSQVCTTILGTALIYMMKAYFETKAEKRNEMIKSGLIDDKDSSIIPNEAIQNKIHGIINSGSTEHINIGSTNVTQETENPDDSSACG